MNSDDHHSIIMTVDLRKFRFRIHRTTLHALGDPSCVQLMFDPVQRAILLMTTSKSMRFGQEEKVYFDHSGKDGSFELYSKTLIQKIQKICPLFQDCNTYTLYGKHIPSRHAVFFSLNSLRRLDNNEVVKNAGRFDDRPRIQGNDSSAKEGRVQEP